MSQHDYVIANGTGAAVRSDLNNALAAIVTQNSGATAPATTYAYQWWADTTTGLLKLRNAANNAWITLFQLDGEWSTLAVENGSASAPSIYFKDSGTDTGIYSPGADQVAISTNGTQRLAVDTAATTSTLPVVHPLGAVGTPSITFTGDLNTGIWSPAADTVAASTGGSERLRIDSSGRVGIGYTTPGNQNASASQLVVGNTSQNNGITILTGTTNDGVLNFNDGDNNSVRGYVIYEHSSDSLRFASNGSERFRCDSSGRLLVGTSSARSWSNITGQFQLDGTTVSGSSAILAANINGIDGSYLSFIKSRGTTVGSNTVVSSGDLLGGIYFNGTDGTAPVQAAVIQAAVDGTPGTNSMPGRLVFSTTASGAGSPTERMRISSAGNLSVGTATSAGTSITAPTIGLWNSGSNNSIQWFAGNPTPSMRFTAWWDVGNNLYITDSDYSHGVALAQNSNSWGSFSDERLKKNINPLTNSIDIIQAVKPCRFQWRSGSEPDVGFIAQELKPILPEAVDGKESDFRVDEDGRVFGPMTVKYDKLIPVLTAALQEAIGRIESLEAEVAALKAQ